MHPSDLSFKRKFSVNFRRDLTLELAKMSFSSDFSDPTRGDLYPAIFKADDTEESLENAVYSVKSSRIQRVFAEFFPYASYEIKMNLKRGKCGFVFGNDGARVELLAERCDSCISLRLFESDEPISENVNIYCPKAFDLVVAARPGAFDAYSRL